ncbi:putative mediator of RNA polymerase II transcription subunit 26 [Drosophila albomicans]|uniref:Regulatory protein zeste n=1 Tax=Drosophila albomicans TaxID=7291 RepID=A0A6P8X8P7_DROAB|nr:putative mediator of RNA polymerase II transcription subunit 26 [Drosophila albomicans]
MDRVTKPQKKMLITLLRETKYMEGKKEKEWYWEKIQAALNTIGPKKTIIQWKKCWRDMRLTTRKKLAELKRCQLSGGSPPPGIELNQEDNDIIDIVGTEYFYEEMNGELKPENFMTGFDYVPEHFCDAILTAAAGQQQQHMQHQKDPQSHSGQQPQDHHTNDGETNDAPGSSNGGSYQGQNVSQLQSHNGAGTEHGNGNGNGTQPHPGMPQHPAFHGGLHPHLLRRQHTNSAMQRESPFEEKLLQFMQDAFPKKSKKRKQRDPDKLFLLSLYEEIKRVPEEIRLDVKSELMQILKKYQKKSPVKAEKSSASTSSASKQSGNSSSSSAAAHLSHGMYQLQKKYEKGEKETSPQSQVDPVPLHAPQQLPLFQLQKKYEESAEKVHQQQSEQRKLEAAHQQQHAAHQQPPPPPNEQHLHHPQMAHNIMFPLAQLRNEQPPSQQHHAHNPHQQQQHPHQQQQQSQQQQQHHPPTIFGSAASAAAMSTDRPAMSYENVG